MGLKNGSGDEHRYQLCKDEYCERFPCRLYKEGHRNGFEEGYQKGYEEGYANGYEAGYKWGYDDGFPDGIAACPRPHK